VKKKIAMGVRPPPPQAPFIPQKYPSYPPPQGWTGR